MTIAQLRSRLRTAWNRIRGRIDRMILKMSLPALEAIVATASAAADNIITAAQGSAAKLADAQATIDNFQQDAVAVVQPLADKLLAADPGPLVTPLEASASLASGVVGQAYTGAISISGGTGPYSVTSVPPSDNGLTVNADGSISGTPEAAATSSFEITVTDSASPPASVSVAASVESA